MKLFYTEKGKAISATLQECFRQLNDIAQRNNIPLDELVVYSLGTAISDEKTAATGNKVHILPESKPTLLS